MDTLWRTISQINEAFSHLGIIWCEIINHIKRLEREWTNSEIINHIKRLEREWTNSVSLFFRRIEK